MKVVLVRRGWSATGGAEAYLERLAGALVKGGHRVRLVASGWPRQNWPHGDLTELPGKTPRSFARSFASLHRAPDEIYLSLERVPDCHIFRAGDGVHAAWLARRKQFESPWKKWTRHLNPKHRALLALEKQVFDPQRTRFVIVNSLMVAKEIEQTFSFPSDRVLLVRNGYDPTGLPPDETRRRAARKNLGLPAEGFLALFVGSGWERKGLRNAIRACERAGGTTLLVAGRGDQKIFSAPHVHHLGPVQDLSVVMAAADVLFQPTWYDPFSNACLEGLAAGLPVITTRDNGFSELIKEKETGSIIANSCAEGESVVALRYWREECAGSPEIIRARCFSAAVPWSGERNLQETLEVLRRCAD